MRRSMVLQVGLACAGLFATSLPARAQANDTRTFHAVAHGRTTVMRGWTCWFPAPKCGYAPCHMTTVEEPKFGVVRPRVYSGPIPARGGACAGSRTTMLDLIYTPRRGAHGSDLIVLQTQSDNGSNHRIEISIDLP